MFQTSPGPSSGGKYIYICDARYLLLCLADSLVRRTEFQSILRSKLSAKRNNKYVASHKYSFLLMMNLEKSKTCIGYK
jgi:hypothetical protein